MRKVKEPIKKPWIWIVMIAILVLGVPWYFPDSAVNPIILGFPLWAFVSVIMTVVLSWYLSYLCMHEWNIVEDEEEGQNGEVQ